MHQEAGHLRNLIRAFGTASCSLTKEIQRTLQVVEDGDNGQELCGEKQMGALRNHEPPWGAHNFIFPSLGGLRRLLVGNRFGACAFQFLGIVALIQFMSRIELTANFLNFLGWT